MTRDPKELSAEIVQQIQDYATAMDEDDVIVRRHLGHVPPGIYGLLREVRRAANAEARAVERERIARLFEAPLAWLCLDNGHEEVRTIVHAIRTSSPGQSEGSE